MELTSRSSLYSWMQACGVDFNSLPEFSDVENILPEIEEIMQRANVVLSVQVGENGWVSGGQSGISPAPAGVTVTQKAAVSEPVPQKSEGESPFPPAPADIPVALLPKLLHAIDVKAQELGFGVGLDSGGRLTEAGRKFAAEHVAPFCAEKGIPRSFNKMSDPQIEELLSLLESLKKEPSEDDSF